MKKLALTSLLAVFAVSGANAANINYGNPLYRPDMGHFYSETLVGMDTDFDNFSLMEEFGYGISDQLSVIIQTSGSYDSSDSATDKFSWDDFSLGLNFRYVDQGEWKADVYGRVAQAYDTSSDLEVVAYNWTLGTKYGYMTSDWTIAATAEINYFSDDVEILDYDAMGMTLGLEGQYVMDSNWNMIAGLDYNFSLTSDVYPYVFDNPLNAKLGVNYNMDATKYVGVYATKGLKEDSDVDPFAMGVKFGIDF